MPPTSRKAEARVTPVGTPKEAWPHAQKLARELKAAGVYVLVHEDPRRRRLFEDDEGRQAFFLTHAADDPRDAAETAHDVLNAYWGKQIHAWGTLSVVHASERTGEKTDAPTGVVRFRLTNSGGAGFFAATLRALHEANVPVQQLQRVDGLEAHAKDLRLVRLLVSRKPRVFCDDAERPRRVRVDFMTVARSKKGARVDARELHDALVRDVEELEHRGSIQAGNGTVDVRVEGNEKDLFTATASKRLRGLLQKAADFGVHAEPF